MPQSARGALEHAGVSHIEFKSFGFQQPTCFDRLRNAGGRQVHVGPAGEAIFKIPG